MPPTRCAIIVHGGAGRISDGLIGRRLDGCRIAAAAGWNILHAGGAALDAVQKAVEVLEDDPLFNAGTGAVLNTAGKVQMDASIMDGSTLSAGAAAWVNRIRHPIALARQILEDGRHVLLVGEPALDFARARGIPECLEQDLIVERQYRRWQERHGTVGCVALDQSGKIAAGTSTGGRFDSLPGRVGDSALIGCGTYADELAGVSCTGIGEAIIRTVLAKLTVDFLHAGLSIEEAANLAITRFGDKTQSEAGLIGIDRQGRIAHVHNTPHMPICHISGRGEVQTAN